MAAAQDPLLAAADELEAAMLDTQVDAGFARAGLADPAWPNDFPHGTTTGEPHPDVVPISTTIPSQPDPIPDEVPVTDADLQRYEQLFDLQTRQLQEITNLSRDSLDRVLEMMERLGFADAYKAKLTNFDLILRSILGVGESAGEPQEPEVPDPGSQ